MTTAGPPCHSFAHHPSLTSLLPCKHCHAVQPRAQSLLLLIAIKHFSTASVSARNGPGACRQQQRCTAPQGAQAHGTFRSLTKQALPGSAVKSRTSELWLHSTACRSITPHCIRISLLAPCCRPLPGAASPACLHAVSLSGKQSRLTQVGPWCHTHGR